MADDMSGGANAAVATGETLTTEQDIQQQEIWTAQELEEIVGRAVDTRVSSAVQRVLEPFQRQFDQRVTRVEQDHDTIREVASMTKRQQAALRAIVAGNVSAGNLDESVLETFDSDLAAENAARAKEKNEAAIAAARAEIEEVRKGQLSPGQLLELRKSDAWGNTERHLDREAKRQGFAGWKAVEVVARKAAGNAISTDNDLFGFDGWEERASKSIGDQAAERDNEGNAPTETPNIRGGASSNAEAIWARYGREGGFTPEVQAAGKRLGYI